MRYARDNLGWITQKVETVNGVTTTVTYDGFGELLTKTVTDGATNLYNVGYTRDNLGRITQKTETVNGVSGTWNYGYDGDGRLDAVTKNGLPVASYGYDQNGNRVSLNAANIASMTPKTDFSLIHPRTLGERAGVRGRRASLTTPTACC